MGSPALWGILAVVTLATYVWRAGGVVIAARIDPDGALSRWFGCVAYGMVAGLISRILLLPSGVLAETPLIDRLAALAVGFVLFLACRRHMVPGMLGAVLAFAALAAARAEGML